MLAVKWFFLDLGCFVQTIILWCNHTWSKMAAIVGWVYFWTFRKTQLGGGGTTFAIHSCIWCLSLFLFHSCFDDSHTGFCHTWVGTENPGIFRSDLTLCHFFWQLLTIDLLFKNQKSLYSYTEAGERISLFETHWGRSNVQQTLSKFVWARIFEVIQYGQQNMSLLVK